MGLAGERLCGNGSFNQGALPTGGKPSQPWGNQCISSKLAERTLEWSGFTVFLPLMRDREERMLQPLSDDEFSAVLQVESKRPLVSLKIGKGQLENLIYCCWEVTM